MAKQKAEGMFSRVANILEDWSCRQFDPATTIKQMQQKMHMFICWGVEDAQHYENKALMFRVTGLLFQGIVVITLNGMDTYDIHYVKPNYEEVLEPDMNIYEDMLCDILDGKIEMKPKR